jgi:hypothetical protein
MDGVTENGSPVLVQVPSPSPVSDFDNASSSRSSSASFHTAPHSPLIALVSSRRSLCVSPFFTLGSPSGSIGDFGVQGPTPSPPPSGVLPLGECPTCTELRDTAHALNLPHGRTIRDHLYG